MDKQIKKTAYFFAILSVCALSLFPDSAVADKGLSHGKNKNAAAHKAKKNHDKQNAVSSKDRGLLSQYLAGGGKKGGLRHCPPGLAKKNNGCLPPGIAKKYAIGSRLPDDVNVHSLPREILDLLFPPKGHYYGKVDDDVVLISETTRKVVDAVTALSAVAK